MSVRIVLALCAILWSAASVAQVPPEQRAGIEAAEARLEALWALTQKIDANAERNPQGNVFSFKVAERPIILVSDVNADRMRILTPIAPESVMTSELMRRLLQANFDSALDARYAIAQGLLWGVFLHPLTSLTNEDFLSGVGQAVNVAVSFGTTFSSGALTFGGGDSQAELRRLLEQLQRKNEQPL
ncbi:MAG: hypothetical protein AAF337_13780 [Pseudomonadota bacterium]